MKKILLAIMVLALSIGSIVGCSNSSDDSRTSNKEGEVAKIIYGATDSYDISVNYVAGAWITAGVVETLFTVDNDGNTVELLADGYEKVDDLTWKIKLKENVKFHDENIMDADSVIFSLNRLVESDQMNYVDSIEKDSDYSVLIKTKTPYAALLSKLSEYKSAIVSPKNTFKDSLIGTGPFKFDRTEKDVKTVVSKFDEYWGGEVKLDGIELVASEDDMSNVYMLYNKDVDASYLPVPVTEVENINAKDYLKVEKNEKVEQTVLLINTKKEHYRIKM